MRVRVCVSGARVVLDPSVRVRCPPDNSCVSGLGEILDADRAPVLGATRLGVAGKARLRLVRPHRLAARRWNVRRGGYHPGISPGCKCLRGCVIAETTGGLHVHPRGGGREGSRDRLIVLIEEDAADAVMR